MAYIIERYRRYFNSVQWEKGRDLFINSRITLHTVKGGYLEDRENMVLFVDGIITDNCMTYNTSIVIDEKELISNKCQCNELGNIRSFWAYSSACEHVAATIFAIVDYCKKNSLQNNTNRLVYELISNYEGEKIVRACAENIQEKVDIVPKLEVENCGCAKLNFRIGGQKKYVVKNLFELVDGMHSGEKIEFGKNFRLICHNSSFTTKGQKYISFIMNRIHERNIEINTEPYTRIDKKNLWLSPYAFDCFFDIAKEEELDVLRTDNHNERVNLKCQLVEENPKIKIYVDKVNNKKDVSAIKITVEDLKYFEGEKNIYVLLGDKLYRTDDEYMKIMKMFYLYMEENKYKPFLVDKRDIGLFYVRVLDTIEGYCEIIEDEDLDITEYMLDKPEFVFYFDADEKNVLCSCKVKYKDKIIDKFGEETEYDIYRDNVAEYEIQKLIKTFLPYYDEKKNIFHVNSEEDKIYSLLQDGMQTFTEFGEVNVSDNFGKIKIRKSPAVSVGVSIFSDLLNLTMHAENFDLHELSAVLSSYRLRKKYHRLKNGEFVSLEGGSLATLSEMIDSMRLSVKDITSGKINVPMYRALYLDKLLNDGEDVEYERDDKFRQLLRNFKSVDESEYMVPDTLNKVLRKYQKTGYRWLRTIEDYGFGGILADDMGLGKTLQTISMFLATKSDENVNKALVVCPASLVFNWVNEINHFAPEIKVIAITGSAAERETLLKEIDKYQVLVTSYDLLKRDIEHYESIAFRYEVIDEAQNIKNHTTQNAKAVKIINAKTKYALTGTPIENRLSELWSIFDYLMPGFLYSYEKFKKNYEIPIARDRDSYTAKRLRKMISPFILRRVKQEVLKDLPAKIEQNTFAKLEGEQQKLYDAFVANMKLKIIDQNGKEFDKNKFKILAELTRLRQICCDPRLCIENYKSESAKLDICMELVESAISGGHKILLFSQFTSMLSIIGKKLDEMNISYYEIIGSTPKDKRVKLVEKFNQDDTSVFLISLKAGGTGLNLTGADIVIHYDPWWNVASQNQATDRAHRIGQKKVVTVFKIIAKGTIEEKIIAMQESKMDLANQILTGETNYLSNMTKEDLLDLL